MTNARPMSSRRMRRRLDELEATLLAIRNGDVDHLVVAGQGVVALQNARERDLQHDLRNAQALAQMGTWTYPLGGDGAMQWSEQMYMLHGRAPWQGPPTLPEL